MVHGAAVYKVGIPAAERDAMFDTNVRGTARVLDAAIEANVPRIVYVSSVVAFGDTEGATVTEDHVRTHRRFSSFYEETKVLAHEIADERIARGAPIVMVQPGGVYGPGDHSQLGTMIHQAATGKLKMKMLPEAGYLLAYVDDVAAGIVQALDSGEVGESYVLGGECVTMGELVDRAAAAAGRKAPARHDAHAADQGLRPAGALRGPDDGLPAQPARADPLVRRRDLLRPRRQGPSSTWATPRARSTTACARRSPPTSRPGSRGCAPWPP